MPNKLLGLASAPKSRYHVTMTRSAILRVSAEYFNDNLIPDAKNISSEGKLTVQLLFKQHYGAGVSSKGFNLAIVEIEDNNAKVDLNKATQHNPNYHFDAEHFQRAQELLQIARRNTITSIKSGHYARARQYTGRIFHTLQDFYR